MKNKLQKLWWGYLGNPWWWVLGALVVFVIVGIIVIFMGVIEIGNVIADPERIGQYIGFIKKGIESIK